jgi:hypothetical protein
MAAPDKRYWRGFRLRRMTTVQWIISGLLLVGVVLFARWHNSQDNETRTRVLRSLLDLPPTTIISDFQRLNKSDPKAPRIALIAQLSQAEMDSYRAKLESPLWLSRIPDFGDTALQVISPGSIKWRSLPTPVAVGNNGVGWSSLSARAVARIRNGHMLCVALQERKLAGKSGGGPTQLRSFTARDCIDVPRTDTGLTILFGAIDHDTRTLHAMIQ